MTKTFSGADLLHFHWMCDLMDYQDTLDRVPLGTPIVWTLHDMSPFTGGCSFSLGCNGFEEDCSVCPHVLSPLAQRETKRSHTRKMRKVQSIRSQLICVSPSKWLTDQAKRSRIFEGVPCVTIPNGIDLNIFHPRLRAGARRSLALEGELPVFLFVSADVGNPLKSSRLLRQAAEAAGLNRDNCRVVYVGEYGRQDLPDWWRWLGSLKTEAALARCFAAADLTIVPSLADNFPNVVAESLACGTPVAGTRVGGIPEMITDGHNGFLLAPSEPRGLAEILRTFLGRKREDLDHLRHNSRETATDAFDLDVAAHRYLELYWTLQNNKKEASRLRVPA